MNLCFQDKGVGDDGVRPESSASTSPPKQEQKLTNQFNYSERASQTYNNPYRVRDRKANGTGVGVGWSSALAFHQPRHKFDFVFCLLFSAGT